MSDISTTLPDRDNEKTSPVQPPPGSDTPALFDDYATSYDAALNRALAKTGEQREYYAQRRIRWSASCISNLGLTCDRVLDFGCGDGSNASMLLESFSAKTLIGIDASSKSILQARNRGLCDKISFFCVDEFRPQADVDAVYCSGVFHHIVPAERQCWLEYVWAALKPGGIFALWENNPWNPGTRYVMAGCEFDQDAIPLSPLEAESRVSKAGFRILRRDSLFYFPRQLKFARPLERFLVKLPLGGQYQILCRKPS